MTLPRKQAAALERIFAREISGSPLPILQSRAKIYEKLAGDGMVIRTEIRVKGEAKVSGWLLTHRGRIAYCEWASEQEGEGKK